MLQVYEAADFRELEAHCAKQRESFPLLALRVACTLLASSMSDREAGEGVVPPKSHV